MSIQSPLAPAVGADAWDAKRAPVVVPTPLLNAGVYPPKPSAPAAPAPVADAPEEQGPKLSPEASGLIDAGLAPELVARAQMLAQATGVPLTQALGAVKHKRGSAATPGGWSPTGKTEQRTGYWDPDAVEAQRERETTALALGTVAGEEAATAKVKSARDQAAALAADAGTSQEELDAWEKNLTKEQRALVDDLQGIAEQRVDPGRLFKDRGAAGSALSMLGDALSTFAEVRAGRPLSNRLAQDIDRDIALQTEEISRKGEERRNELAILRDQFGDLEQAKNALRAKQGAALASRLTVLAAEAEEPAVKSGLEADAAKWWADMQGRLEGLSQGTRSESQSSAYRQATAGSAGGYYVDPEDVAKFAASGATPQQQTTLAAYAAQVAPLDQYESAVNRFIAANNLTLDPESGLVDPQSVEGSGLIMRNVPAKYQSELGMENNLFIDDLNASVLFKRMGAANTEQAEYVKASLGTGSTATPEQKIAAVNFLLRQAQAERASAESSVLDPQVKKFQRETFQKSLARQNADLRKRAQQWSSRGQKSERTPGEDEEPQPQPSGEPLNWPAAAGRSR